MSSKNLSEYSPLKVHELVYQHIPDKDLKFLGSGGYGNVYLVSDDFFPNLKGVVMKVSQINEQPLEIPPLEGNIKEVQLKYEPKNDTLYINEHKRELSLNEVIRLQKAVYASDMVRHIRAEGISDTAFSYGTYTVGFGKHLFVLDFMEYIQGKPLTFIKDTKTKEINLCATLYDVITFLECSQKLGIVHADLKPNNIMTYSKDIPSLVKTSIIDFDNAKSFKEIKLEYTFEGKDELIKRKMENIIIGTSCYFSPEHVSRERLIPQSDWYSLGIIATNLFRGQENINFNIMAFSQPRVIREVALTVLEENKVNEDIIEGIAGLLHVDPLQRDLKNFKSSLEDVLESTPKFTSQDFENLKIVLKNER